MRKAKGVTTTRHARRLGAAAPAELATAVSKLFMVHGISYIDVQTAQVVSRISRSGVAQIAAHLRKAFLDCPAWKLRHETVYEPSTTAEGAIAGR